MAQLAYSSFSECKIRTGWNVSTSRMRPPKVAVIMPHSTQRLGAMPAESPLMLPTTAKVARPSASAATITAKSVFQSDSRTAGQKKSVATHVSTEI
eukprot:CAMPEP_0172814556 /NCGR_PEP_ID=MMETSP1075-20121228/11297_1 /TAXON_ID=2916 /ORGANISM="Ceratium fusus, Strain PA161109" /LENGTH=95 /DNA_ID=CAMNT_0013654357 /DNA_START=248 /DNA_END=535 /DNA_ORIENTATION=+